MKYSDHFADKSDQYLQFRPDYPAVLFQYLADIVKIHEAAWDCGTGNGQAAVALASYFDKVIATDVNQAQLDVAPKMKNIFYLNDPAEKTQIANHSIDLITVAQALHWFKLDEFYSEVKRVAKKNAYIAAWCYSLCSINEKIDAQVNKLYWDILGDVYWPKERTYIDEQYITIPFPFKKISAPAFVIEKNINYLQFVGYLNTWSALKAYQNKNHNSPFALIEHDLQSAWGDLTATYPVRWPIYMVLGQVK